MPNPAVQDELTPTSSSCCNAKSESVCFHCHEPLSPFANINANIDGDSVAVCCYGCKTAAEFISEQGLANFYQERDNQRIQPQTTHQGQAIFTIEDWGIATNPEAYEATIAVPGLYCSSCAWLVKKTLGDLSAEHSLALETIVQVDNKQISLTWKNQFSADINNINLIAERLSKLGYPARPINKNQTIQSEHAEQESSLFLKRIVVAGLGTMQVMTYAVAHYLGAETTPDIARFLELVSMLVATVVVMYSGQHFFNNAWRDLKNKHLGMDVPIALAIGSAFFLSVFQTLTQWQGRVLYYDSAVMFVFFLLLGRYVEIRARHNFIDSADAVSNSLPTSVDVVRGVESSSQHLSVSPQAIVVGDVIEVNSGEIIPCDGTIITGSGEFDESLVTGESKPIFRQQSQHLLTSMRLVSGQIKLRCSHDWKNSSVASLQKLINNGKQLPHTQNDSLSLISRYFVLAILILIVPVAAFWLTMQPERTFEVVLAMLIASCPCAFALASPVGVTVASNVLRKNGVLLANGEALNLVAKAKLWCFDKTGTLTEGKPEIISITPFDPDTNVGNLNSHYLDILAALEKNSRHPLANAFACRATNLRATNIEENSGNGVHGEIDGKTYSAGKLSWIKQRITNKHSAEELTQPDSGYSEVYLANQDKILACVLLCDKARDGLDDIYQSLSEQHIESVLISGDNHASVSRFIELNRFENYYSEQTPKAKLDLLNAYASKYQPTVVVGDGANDAPMLARADVAIAFASGSELSHAQADFLILNRSLKALSVLQRVANKSSRIMKQNLIWAVAYNAIVLPMAASGLLTPWIAAIGMSLSSLGVVFNAARINRLEAL